jgi:hypothetical protein
MPRLFTSLTEAIGVDGQLETPGCVRHVAARMDVARSVSLVT